MKKLLVISTILALGVILACSFNSKKEESAQHIKWMTMQEALDASKKKPKKILVDVYTDWCGWCKRMDKATYEDAKVVKYINANYYAVKFNSERENDITYLNKTYKMPTGGGRATHELAVYLLQGQMSYPSTVILAEDHSVIQNIPGYQEPAMMDMILNYFGGDNHKKNVDWNTFQANYGKK